MAYVLGHSSESLRGLRRSAAGRPDHAPFLLEAGIESGMRVLDVGSGAGDVAPAAELVGETGEVVGLIGRLRR
jgi:tRNA A58 N-methylase Trm61